MTTHEIRFQGELIEHMPEEAARVWLDAKKKFHDENSRPEEHENFDVTQYEIAPRRPVELYQRGNLIETFDHPELAQQARDAIIREREAARPSVADPAPVKLRHGAVTVAAFADEAAAKAHRDAILAEDFALAKKKADAHNAREHARVKDLVARMTKLKRPTQGIKPELVEPVASVKASDFSIHDTSGEPLHGLVIKVPGAPAAAPRHRTVADLPAIMADAELDEAAAADEDVEASTSPGGRHRSKKHGKHRSR